MIMVQHCTSGLALSIQLINRKIKCLLSLKLSLEVVIKGHVR